MSRAKTPAGRPWYDRVRGRKPRPSRGRGGKGGEGAPGYRPRPDGAPGEETRTHRGETDAAGRVEKKRERARKGYRPGTQAGGRKRGGFGYRPRPDGAPGEETRTHRGEADAAGHVEIQRERARKGYRPGTQAGGRKRGGFGYRPRSEGVRREKGPVPGAAPESRQSVPEAREDVSPREGAAPTRRPARERVLTARACALAVLRRALGSGLFASELLDREFRGARMRPDDRGLATELVFGCLRMRGTLDRAIEQSAGRPMGRISRELRDILRLGMYQLLYLDRIPAYAAVDESVKLALRHGRKGAEKFVNAVLRNAPKEVGQVRMPDRAVDPAAHIAAARSHPEWLVRRWADRMGEAEAEALCLAGNEAPPLTARVNTVRATRESLLAALAAEGVRAVPNPGHPLAVDIEELPRPIPELAAFRNGLFWIQDVAAMRVADLVGARRGERIADLCAGPGGKAAALAASAGDGAELFCVELNPAKAEMVRGNAARLGLRSIRCVVGDAREAGRIPGLAPADRALVDAPCSNTGVLRRRPEARWRLRPEDIPRLAAAQGALLAAAADVVKPGGVLVYGTCSIEPDENERVVAAFLLAHPAYLLDEELRMLPRTGGCDGGYAARMVKRNL